MPFSTILVTMTDPSMHPCSLTDRVVGAPASLLTLPLIWPSRCSPPTNSTSPLIRVFAPISVSISAFLLGFGLNICFTLARNIAVRFRFHRHALRLPHERLPETMIGIPTAVNLDTHARRLKSRRQFYGLVVFLKILEGVCQADPAVRRDLRVAQGQ